MTLRELLPAAPLPRVLSVLERHYEEVPADRVEALYRRLAAMEPAAGAELEVSVTAYRDAGEKIAAAGSFHEDDPDLMFDVSATAAGDGWPHSIAGLSCGEFLALRVSGETLGRFTPASIVAHCLWEVTAYGWDPDCRDGSIS